MYVVVPSLVVCSTDKGGNSGTVHLCQGYHQLLFVIRPVKFFCKS